MLFDKENLYSIFYILLIIICVLLVIILIKYFQGIRYNVPKKCASQHYLLESMENVNEPAKAVPKIDESVDMFTSEDDHYKTVNYDDDEDDEEINKSGLKPLNDRPDLAQCVPQKKCKPCKC